MYRQIARGSNSGVTGASYTNALVWQCSELGNKTMLLKNVHATNSLKYKLLGYAGGGIAKELVAETTLLSGETAQFHYDRQWQRLELQVINGTGAATYQVDYEGQGV
ncbi:MAG TPA: hypothetical protein VLH15_04875 [Dehalococcoidales bacterium]|nr:hypothetical protein [Dehalococcoidales bacterium]